MLGTLLKLQHGPHVFPQGLQPLSSYSAACHERLTHCVSPDALMHCLMLEGHRELSACILSGSQGIAKRPARSLAKYATW